MAGKFIDLVDAARMIGVSPEQLVEMRSRGEIFGFRDGSTWKFKQEEVDRVIGDRSSGSGVADEDSGAEILSADQDFEDMITGLSSKVQGSNISEEEQESILITDDEASAAGSGIGGSKKGPSTIIGQDGVMGGESDIRLAADDSGSHGSRTGHSDALAMPDMNLAQAGSDILGGSVPGMQSPSSTGLMGSMSKPSVQPHDTGIHQSGSDSASAMDDDDLLLAPEGGGSVIEEVSLSDVDLDLAGAASDSSLTASPSDKSAPSGGSGVDDELSLDGDFVLADERPKGKSGVGSDVSLGGDSGINLLPSDGGLSLEEEPLDLGGSAVDSLELPGDDQFVSLEEEADPDQATQLKADDQFMLSPSDAIGEEESDSGSQVIALEESESFDNDAATMLRGQAGMGAPLVADEMFAQPGMMAPGMMAGAAMAAGMAPGYAPQPVEAPYTIWQVVFLMALTGVMGLSAILIADVMQNMWTWQENGTAATFVMDNVIGMFGLDK